MTNCFRHFRALFKKNGLLWIRTPCCSAFEILAPMVMMIVLWIIRLQVPTTSVDVEGMLSKNLDVMPGVGKSDNGKWATNTGENHYVNDKVTPLMAYANYTTKR